ncbi:hypothetical protein HU675_0038100 [Bradyrhizobium septentrionale]|uniref:hypothetical protein n=1 Tax=Bradyrhizobium septentrionale TaxID=1404411 RepID=UPI0015965FE9|nr:hypothetical protein [Bradyrhizobium septentrionale]UGY23699.1 hypothetical protein HU675_0038100 [Bradyrhizobium septentrionale]
MGPHVIIVGADKGGVGKTTVSRTLRDYFHAHGISVRAFDTEAPNGVFKRFHPDVEVVDLTQSDDQMKVFDKLREAQVTLIDIRATLLSTTLATLSEIGFLDGVKEGRLRISVVHVIGSSQASFDEIDATAKAVEGATHHVLLNHTNGTKFAGLPASAKDAIVIPQLNTMANDTIDRLGVGFEAYIADKSQSEVLQGYARAWLKKVYAAYDKVALNAL